MSIHKITFNEHNTLLGERVQKLFLSEEFSDASVLCCGELLPIHRIVISNYSEYFDDLIEKSSSNTQKIVKIKEYKLDVVKALLEFMYKGKIEIPIHKLDKLVELGKVLKVKGLVDKNNSPEKSPVKSQFKDNAEETNQVPETPSPPDPSTFLVSVFLL